MQEQRIGQASLSIGATALSKLKSRVRKQSVTAERSTKGGTARDGLAHISVNLPEAPAFRHTYFGGSVPSHHTDSQSQSGNVLGFSHLPTNSAAHVGPSVVAQSHGGQPRHSSVTFAWPESPKRKITRAHNPSHMSHPGFSHGMSHHADAVSWTDAATAFDMPPAEGLLGTASKAAGPFLAAPLDAGPPRLAPAAFESLSGWSHSGHSGTADADRLAADAGPSVMTSQRAGPGGCPVELPLRQSDFSR